MPIMGEIKDTVVISYERPVKVEAIFDTGADLNVIEKDSAEEAGLIIGDKIFDDLKLADGRTLKYKMAMGRIEIKGCKAPMIARILVEEKPVAPCIIGVMQMEIMGITLNPQDKSYTIGCKIPRI